MGIMHDHSLSVCCHSVTCASVGGSPLQVWYSADCLPAEGYVILWTFSLLAQQRHQLQGVWWRASVLVAGSRYTPRTGCSGARARVEPGGNGFVRPATDDGHSAST